MAKKEPTNREVLEAVNERFNMVFTEITRMDRTSDLMFKQLNLIRSNGEEMQAEQKADGEVLDEIRDTLEAVSKAVDKDALLVINLDRRVSKLEHAK
jgi:hypothetical protein